MVEELEKLKKYLPKGYTLKLAKEFGVNQVTIIHALKGKHHRFDIIKRAVELAKENIAILKELGETVNEAEK
jgi:phage terminase large subunit